MHSGIIAAVAPVREIAESFSSLSYTAVLMTHLELGPLLILACGAAGFTPWAKRLCRGRNRLTPLALLGLLLWSSTPVSKVLALSLEAAYPSRVLPEADADAIVILSGGVVDTTPTQPFAFAGQSTYERTLFGAWLYKNWKAVPIIVSGGPIGAPPDRAVASILMHEILAGKGIPEEHIWEEDRSLNTRQNGLYTLEILRARGIRRIVLVTDARHMLRAERVFRRLDIDLIPMPCCKITDDLYSSWRDLVPSHDGVRENEATLHEWGGLVWYWLRGWV